MRDWLGTPLRHRLVKDSGFLSFEDARTFARSLGLTSGKEWEAYCRSGARPRDIPGSPDSLYRDQGWAGIKDWLGAPPRYRFRTFEDARSYVWTLGIKSQAEWSKYCKSGGRPSDIPATPRGVYRHRGWADWGDWLGTGYVSVSKQNFWSYEDAKDFVWTLGIKTTREWLRYAKSAKRPAYIPISPHMVYKDKGWCWGLVRDRDHRPPKQRMGSVQRGPCFRPLIEPHRWVERISLPTGMLKAWD
jgi:hypothetical protein